MTSRNLRFSLIAALALAACSQAPQRNLGTTTVPADFTFKMSRSVAMTLASSAALIPLGTTAKLTLARPDGKLLFEGSLGAGSQKAFRVGLPTKDQTVIATLTLGSGKMLQQQIPVVSDAAKFTFE